jgi:hypothetical protein
MHRPTVKIGQGRFSMPIPADVNKEEECILSSIVTDRLGCKVEIEIQSDPTKCPTPLGQTGI